MSSIVGDDINFKLTGTALRAPVVLCLEVEVKPDGVVAARRAPRAANDPSWELVKARSVSCLP